MRVRWKTYCILTRHRSLQFKGSIQNSISFPAIPQPLMCDFCTWSYKVKFKGRRFFWLLGQKQQYIIHESVRKNRFTIFVNQLANTSNLLSEYYLCQNDNNIWLICVTFKQLIAFGWCKWSSWYWLSFPGSGDRKTIKKNWLRDIIHLTTKWGILVVVTYHW